MDGEAGFHQPNLSVKRLSVRVPRHVGRHRHVKVFASAEEPIIDARRLSADRSQAGRTLRRFRG